MWKAFYPLKVTETVSKPPSLIRIVQVQLVRKHTHIYMHAYTDKDQAYGVCTIRNSSIKAKVVSKWSLVCLYCCLWSVQSGSPVCSRRAFAGNSSSDYISCLFTLSRKAYQEAMNFSPRLCVGTSFGALSNLRMYPCVWALAPVYEPIYIWSDQALLHG